MTASNDVVKIGQVYKDNDPRQKSKRLKRVLVVTALVGKKAARVRSSVTGRETQISVKRLLDTTSHGYTYVGSKRGRKPRGGPDLESVTFKVEGSAHKKLMAKARRHAKGNLSAWLRHTGVNYRMRKGEKVDTEAV